MLRFRNRFQGTGSTLHQCPCGRRVTESNEGGRFTLIHELPWCPLFEAIIAKLRADDPACDLHQATVVIDATGAAETILTADGDTTADVVVPVAVVSKGGQC